MQRLGADFRLFALATRIFNTPFATSGAQDMLVWRHDATGEYSVKSGYRVLIIANRQHYGSNLDLVGFVQGYAHELSLSKVLVVNPTTTVIELWRPLNSGGYSNTSTVVVLACNEMGLIMGACTYPYAGIADAFVAEARVCERTLLFAIDIGFRMVILEGDSLTVIKKLTTVKEDRSILRPISQNIQRLEEFLDKVTYQFAPRSVNRAAHTLALEGACGFHLVFGLKRRQLLSKIWWLRTGRTGVVNAERVLWALKFWSRFLESPMLVFLFIFGCYGFWGEEERFAVINDSISLDIVNRSLDSLNREIAKESHWCWKLKT
ncbi:reverse transcriptase [Gossypium australe]|uniref:Reverse transcriptase n=1 Tax=Gossypium australe TaxID=47621 RepID=A0A5B6WJ51_9ROSI|nr:reverse transcriptase [Gossypium australe]